MMTKSAFIGQYIDDITKTYEVLAELGSGSYGKVYRVKSKLTGEIRACKKMNKRKIKNKERFKVEINLLKATDHPNIVKLYEVYEDNVYLYLVMEECLGGEFFDKLASRAKVMNMYNEREAAKIFKQLMCAINYCHSHGVCHRDIKPENILFTFDDDSRLKLIDFGLSKVFSSKSNSMNSIVGTTYYMAPEVLKGEYNEKCDVWSAGVILYIMLCGRPPFFARTDSEIVEKIQEGAVNFNYPEWNNVSKLAKELITLMLVEASKRPSSQKVLDHPWVKDLAPNSKEEVLNLEWNHLTDYAHLNKIQKTVISFVSFRIKDDDTKELCEIFQGIDKNSDGVLTMKEIKEGFTILTKNKNMSITEDELKTLFNEIDLDKNGLVNYNEFLTATLDYKNTVKREQIYEAFRNFDSDKSGKLSFKEITEVIQPQTSDDVDYLQDLVKQFDKNEDGEIDFEEFLEGLDLIDSMKSKKRMVTRMATDN